MKYKQRRAAFGSLSLFPTTVAISPRRNKQIQREREREIKERERMKERENGKWKIKIGQVGRMFVQDPGDWGSIPGWVIPKTLKMVLDTYLLNTHHYKVRIKGKWINPGTEVAPFLTPRCSSYWKGSPRVAFNNGRQLYFYIIFRSLSLCFTRTVKHTYANSHRHSKRDSCTYTLTDRNTDRQTHTHI